MPSRCADRLFRTFENYPNNSLLDWMWIYRYMYQRSFNVLLRRYDFRGWSPVRSRTSRTLLSGFFVLKASFLAFGRPRSRQGRFGHWLKGGVIVAISFQAGRQQCAQRGSPTLGAMLAHIGAHKSLKRWLDREGEVGCG